MLSRTSSTVIISLKKKLYMLVMKKLRFCHLRGAPYQKSHILATRRTVFEGCICTWSCCCSNKSVADRNKLLASVLSRLRLPSLSRAGYCTIYQKLHILAARPMLFEGYLNSHLLRLSRPVLYRRSSQSGVNLRGVCTRTTSLPSLSRVGAAPYQKSHIV